MGFNPGKDWTKESDDLFIHKSGTRITKTTYRSKVGWFLMPPDLDEPVLEFPATDEGRDQALEAYAKGAAAKKPKKKKKDDGKTPVPVAAEEQEEAAEPAEEGAEPAVAAPDEEADDDDDEEEEEEETEAG